MAIVVAMVVIFINMAVSINKALAATSGSATMKYDVWITDLSFGEVTDLYERCKSVTNYNCSFFRTEELRMALSDNDYANGYITGTEGDVFESYGLELTEGRFPENKDEIVISTNLNRITGKDYSLNDSISFEVTDYDYELTPVTKEFTVVGFFEGDGSENSIQFEAFSTIETAQSIKENILYTYSVYTEAASINEWASNVDEIINIASDICTELENKMRCNDDRQQLLQDVPAANSVSFLFYGFALLICIAAYFMIYNIALATFNEKIKHYGFLSSLGMSRKQSFKHYRLTVYNIILAGSIFGVVLGYLANNTIGKFLIAKLTKGVNSDIIRSLVFQNDVSIYLISVLMASLLIIIIHLYMWNKLKKYTIIEQINYIEAENEKVSAKKEAFADKKSRLIKIIGEKNMTQHKKSNMCLWVNYFMVAMIFLLIIGIIGSLKSEDFREILKCTYSDYQLLSNSYLDDNYSEDCYKEIKEVFGEENVKAMAELSYYCEALSAEEYAELVKEYIKKEGVTDESELSFESQREITAANNVDIYVVDDCMLQELLDENGLKLDEASPIILGKNVDSSEVNIYTDKCITIPLSGTIDFNMRIYSYDNKFELIMNQAAYEEYFGEFEGYNAIYLSTEKTEQEIDEINKELNEKYGMNMVYISTAEQKTEIINETISLLAIAAYLMSCLTFMSVINTVCMLRVALKQRKKEFGILIALGMTKRDAIKLLAYETRKLGISAIIISLPIGIAGAAYLMSTAGYTVRIVRMLAALAIASAAIYGIVVLITRIVGNNIIKSNIVTNLSE